MPSETEAWKSLLTAVGSFYRAEASRSAPGHDLLARAADALACLDRPSREARPRLLPVSPLLADCLEEARAG